MFQNTSTKVRNVVLSRRLIPLFMENSTKTTYEKFKVRNLIVFENYHFEFDVSYTLKNGTVNNKIEKGFFYF